MLTRREALAASVALSTWAASGNHLRSRDLTDSSMDSEDRVLGLLLGSMIGDALGGPVEFQPPEKVADYVINGRGWENGRSVSRDDLRLFADSLQLISYQHFRPEPEPYGQWQANAARGTVTDDTRHKMVLMNALQQASQTSENALTQTGLAEAYLAIAQTSTVASRPQYKQLCEESFREFWKAARWVLGQRDLEVAAPPDRIWGGTPTCCGQMTMLPLAAVYSGRPDMAYRRTYELSFFDVGAAKDINAAIVAGLSIALAQPMPADSNAREKVWHQIAEAMRNTDPYQYQKVPFVERPTNRWLNFAREAVRKSNRQPKLLYKFLEQYGEVKYFWESHFSLALVFAAIEFCDYDPLAAMALILDFGHDTDSGAQLLGAFAGAIHGVGLFPPHLQEPVIEQLQLDYDVSLNDWGRLLLKLAAVR